MCGTRTNGATRRYNIFRTFYRSVFNIIPQNPDLRNALTKYIEKELGIDIQFKFFASGASEQLQQLTLMCSGNETLPDVLCGFISMKQSTVNQFGEDGFFIDLTDPIEEYGVHYKEQIAKLSAEDKIVCKRIYSTAKTISGVQKGSLDTFSLFIELGFRLLRKNGAFRFAYYKSLANRWQET